MTKNGRVTTTHVASAGQGEMRPVGWAASRQRSGTATSTANCCDRIASAMRMPAPIQAFAAEAGHGSEGESHRQEILRVEIALDTQPYGWKTRNDDEGRRLPATSAHAPKRAGS